MGHKAEFDQYRTRESKTPTTIVERRNDHRLVSRTRVPLPHPFHDREIVVKSMWEKLGENAYFFLQVPCEHDGCPELPGFVRVLMRRSIILTKISAKLTRVEMSGSADLGGGVPKRGPPKGRGLWEVGVSPEH